MSLQAWDKGGLLERELSFYQKLQRNLGGLTFVTYGDANDLRYTNRLLGLRVLCNRWRLPIRVYELIMLFVQAPWLRHVTVFKTNQTSVGHVALLAKFIYRKPLIARCGFMASEFAVREFGADSSRAKIIIGLEKILFRFADYIVVTTEQMRQYISKFHNLPLQRVRVIPNYVDTERFKPLPEARKRNSICFIGRLEQQKNLVALLEASKGLTHVELSLIGDGSLRTELLRLAQTYRLPVNFLGSLPYFSLPKHLNRAEIFVLPSLYEGHPKVLLEAMSCGRPVIGTDVPGIRELIRHRETGFLCGTSPADIRAAIQAVLSDMDLRMRIGRQAREFVLENFTLERTVEMEIALLDELAA